MASERDRILQEIKLLIKDIEDHKIQVEMALVFGSFVKGNFTEYSDIDLAVVSSDFQGVRFFDKQKINPILIHHNSRFEVHPYRTDEFDEEKRWFVKEIKENAIRVK